MRFGTVRVTEEKMLLWGGIALAAIIFIPGLGRKLSGAISSSVVNAGIDVAKGVTEGAAYAIGDSIGLPRTDTADSQAKCQAAMDDGSELDVSLYCSATTYLKWKYDNSILGKFVKWETDAFGNLFATKTATPPVITATTYDNAGNVIG